MHYGAPPYLGVPMSQLPLHTDLGYRAYSMPQAEFRRREGIGRNLLTHLFKTGELDSVVVGARLRHVILSSWVAYIDRRQRGMERDPDERAASIAAYAESVRLSSGGKGAAQARSGWLPGHGKQGASPRRAARLAVAERKTPRPADKPKPARRRNARKDTATSSL